MIALVGNPFSARYARARRWGLASPGDFVAMNVALHGPDGISAWCLTERGAAELDRSSRALRIGTSSWSVSGGELAVRLDERTAPFGGRVAGEVHVRLGAAEVDEVALDPAGRHRWWPLAPAARAEVRLTAPAARFAGPAYLDAQSGDEPLETAFRRWTWSRARRGEEAIVSFDIERRDGSLLSLSRRFGAARSAPGPAADAVGLPPTTWRLARTCRSERAPRVVRRLEDGPCYARALVETTHDGARTLGIHEVLDLDRLRAGWVRFLMPFRTRRGA